MTDMARGCGLVLLLVVLGLLGCQPSEPAVWRPLDAAVARRLLEPAASPSEGEARSLIAAFDARSIWLKDLATARKEPLAGQPAQWSWETDWETFVFGLSRRTGGARAELQALLSQLESGPSTWTCTKEVRDLLVLSLPPAGSDDKRAMEVAERLIVGGASREMGLRCIQQLDTTARLRSLPRWLSWLDSSWFVDRRRPNPPVSATRLVREYPSRLGAADALRSLGIAASITRAGETPAASGDDLAETVVRVDGTDLAGALERYAQRGSDAEAAAAAQAAAKLGGAPVERVRSLFSQVSSARKTILEQALSQSGNQPNR